MKEFIDISLPLSPHLPRWPGDPDFKRTEVKRLEDGDSCNLSRIEMGVHYGTHVDAPRHFLVGGPTIENLSLSVLIGEAVVVDLPDVSEIDIASLIALKLSGQVRRLLIKTRNSKFWQDGLTEFQESFVALTAEAAEWLVQRGVWLVGIDYLSIQLFHDDNRTHQILLEAGVVVVEGLNLSAITPGGYGLTCLPLSLVGAEGAPARVVLSRDI